MVILTTDILHIGNEIAVANFQTWSRPLRLES